MPMYPIGSASGAALAFASPGPSLTPAGLCLQPYLATCYKRTTAPENNQKTRIHQHEHPATTQPPIPGG